MAPLQKDKRHGFPGDSKDYFWFDLSRRNTALLRGVNEVRACVGTHFSYHQASPKYSRKLWLVYALDGYLSESGQEVSDHPVRMGVGVPRDLLSSPCARGL